LAGCGDASICIPLDSVAIAREARNVSDTYNARIQRVASVTSWRVRQVAGLLRNPDTGDEVWDE